MSNLDQMNYIKSEIFKIEEEIHKHYIELENHTRTIDMYENNNFDEYSYDINHNHYKAAKNRQLEIRTKISELKAKVYYLNRGLNPIQETASSFFEQNFGLFVVLGLFGLWLLFNM